MRDVVTPGHLVIVGGHSRGVGKTLFIERWLAADRARPWTAIKVSAHRHAPAALAAPLIEESTAPSSATQTGRYLAAGAARAFLLRAPDTAVQQAAHFITALRTAGVSVIVESNRLVTYLRPEQLFFVIDPDVDDWKPSSAASLRDLHVVLCVHQRGPGHDHHSFRSTVGDGAAFGIDSLHRVAVPRAAAV